MAANVEPKVTNCSLCDGLGVVGSHIGVQLIADERQRQISAEHWTADHDDAHTDGELRDAAIAYAIACEDRPDHNRPDLWPWDLSSWKPSNDPIRNLVKAGALIAAEIDRLQRKHTRDEDE